jgi:hypothetical protein
MTNTEESTANHEIISALVVAMGMISLMMNEVAGLLILLAGTGSLALVYGYRLFAAPQGSTNGGLSRMVNRVNYLVLIAGLALMVAVIFSDNGKLAYAATGILVLTSLAALDLLICHRRYFQMKLGYCLLRISLVIMLLLLFYFFPIR